MEVDKQIELKFHGVDFPIINLHSDKIKDPAEDLSINIDVDAKVLYLDENPQYFKIIQKINLFADKHFKLFILAIGTFEMSEETSPDHKKSFVNINAPAIMFPYVRSFISTLTANIGGVTGVLTIPPQFFRGEIQEVSEDDVSSSED